MGLLSGINRWIHSAFGGYPQLRSPAVDFKKLERVLNHHIKNKEYFIEALTHRSYLQSPDSRTTCANERLEFLGDSILNLAVAEYLFHQNSSAPEGDLTKIRARLVNRKALCKYARDLNLIDFVLMSHGASQGDDKGLDTILSDAYEAIIGAIYLDGGYAKAQQFVKRHLELAMERGIINTEDENHKSRLLEYAQAEGLGSPRYRTVSEKGPDHDRIFTMEVCIGDTVYGTGAGKNKKEAEQQAAANALQKILTTS